MPSQEELNTFYASGQYWHEPGGNPYQVAHESHQAKIRVSQVISYLAIGSNRPLRVMDVGAGHGCIADWLQGTAGIALDRYLFIEPDEENARIISSRPTKYPMIRANEFDSVEPNTVDLIFLNHVLEHVARPREFLSDALQRLRTGGIAYVETPFQDFRFKSNVFPHLHFFTPRSMRALLNGQQVSVMKCETFGAWPGTSAGISALSHRILDRAFRICVDAGLRSMQHWLDRMVWRYESTTEGIWIRWILKKG